MPRLEEVARYVRSKNAGPFWVTLDVFADDDATFVQLSAAPLLAPASIAAIYGVPAAQVRVFRDPALRVIKVSYPRRTPQGSASDADSHAGQAFVALSRLPLDWQPPLPP